MFCSVHVLNLAGLPGAAIGVYLKSPQGETHVSVELQSWFAANGEFTQLAALCYFEDLSRSSINLHRFYGFLLKGVIPGCVISKFSSSLSLLTISFTSSNNFLAS